MPAAPDAPLAPGAPEAPAPKAVRGGGIAGAARGVEERARAALQCAAELEQLREGLWSGGCAAGAGLLSVKGFGHPYGTRARERRHDSGYSPRRSRGALHAPRS